ncbi:MAG TPA: VCBS repeat-containing protein, partial [Gemmataceae bacterium]
MDLDGDGIPDLISGSWPGEIFFFKGKGKGRFEAPVKLKDKNGKTINIGGGRQEGGDMILVAGDAQYENTAKGTVIVYEGERIEVPEGKEAGITGTASAVHAVDW